MKISGHMDSIESATAFRRQFFKDTDANSDGQITKDEYTSAKPERNSGPIMGPGVDEIFRGLMRTKMAGSMKARTWHPCGQASRGGNGSLAIRQKSRWRFSSEPTPTQTGS